MGWFDWLTEGSVEEGPECVWFSTDAKWQGVVKTVALRLDAPDCPTALLVVAHFPETLNELCGVLKDVRSDKSRLQATTVESLLAASQSAMALQPSDRLEIIAVERHFLPDHDDQLLQFARKLRCRCRLAYHLSLEDPLLQAFASQWVRGVLRQVGMTDDQAIQSGMVSRRIRSAQLKFARRQVHDHPARSAEEWLALNVGDAQG